MDPILELIGVQKAFGKAQVVRDLHLSVEPGEFVTLLGPSGCGKSTTLNLIAGLLQPDAGSIYLRGELVNAWEPQRRRLGMVFQTWALFPHMDAYENIAFGLRLQRLQDSEIRDRVAEMLALVRLPGIATKYPSQLSGGMQQRIALARALAPRPNLLLLDEPLSNLDARLRKEMQVELKRIHEQLRVTTVFVTHSQEEALVLSDRVAVMNHGSIIRIDTPAHLYSDPHSRFVCTFLGEVNLLEGVVVASREGRVGINVGPMYVTASISRPIDVGERLCLALRPEAISIRANQSSCAENSVPATIRDIMFKGEAIVCSLDVSGTELIVLEYPKVANGLVRGARVFAEFEASALSLIEDP